MAIAETAETAFDLLTTADYPHRTAELRLLDEHGSQLAFRQTSFQTIAASRQQGLFNLREYLRHYIEPGREIASVAEIGFTLTTSEAKSRTIRRASRRDLIVMPPAS